MLRLEANLESSLYDFPHYNEPLMYSIHGAVRIARDSDRIICLVQFDNRGELSSFANA